MLFISVEYDCDYPQVSEGRSCKK